MLYPNESKGSGTIFADVLPNKVLVKELVKLPEGFNHCWSKRETLFSWAGHRVRSPSSITDAGGFFFIIFLFKTHGRKTLGFGTKMSCGKEKKIRNIQKCLKEIWRGKKKTDVKK